MGKEFSGKVHDQGDPQSVHPGQLSGKSRLNRGLCNRMEAATNCLARFGHSESTALAPPQLPIFPTNLTSRPRRPSIAG